MANEKERANISAVLSKKKGFCIFQVAVAISVCLYWKLVTHTHTHNRTSM